MFGNWSDALTPILKHSRDAFGRWQPSWRPESGFGQARVIDALLKVAALIQGIVNPLPDGLARISQCAPKARNTSGGRFHPESCRLIW
jgi:hypothetical protein